MDNRKYTKNLEAYAHLVIASGCNLKPGQEQATRSPSSPTATGQNNRDYVVFIQKL
jgi:hypothetical protein